MAANPGQSVEAGPGSETVADAEAFADARAAQPPQRPAKERLSEAGAELRAGLHQFVVTMKNLALYPDTSQTNIQGIRQLREWFAGYIRTRGAIVLEVKKDGLETPDGEKVYQEKPNEPYLSFPLFRDGIQTLFVEDGVTEAELKAFIGILLKFRTTNESAQDDVVTSMWDIGFEHVKYAVADEYEEVDPEFDLGAMVCARPPSTGGPTRIDPDAPGEADAPVQTDGTAPVAKNIGSLFALADSLDFSFAPGGADGRVEDPHEGGKLLPSTSGGGSGAEGGSGGDGLEGPDDDEEDDPFGEDGGFGPMGGAAGPSRKPPPGAGFSDGSFYKDDSGRVKRGTGRQDGQTGGAEEKDGGEGGGLGTFRGAGVGAPKGGHGEAVQDAGDPRDDARGEGAAAGGYDSPGSVYDPDGDPDGHPVKGPADAEGEPPESDGGEFGNALQNLDLSGLNTDSFDERTEMSQPVTLADDEERPEIDEKTREGRAQRLKFWGLSSREIKQVQALIQWDEARGKTASVLDLVTVLVESPVLRPSMLPSLVKFLAEEFRESCARLSIAYVNAFLARLQDLAAKAGWEGPCAKLRHELLKVIAVPELLETLAQAVQDDEACAQNHDGLRYFLYQLPQGSAMSIALAMPAARSVSFKKLMVEVICWQLPSVLDQFGKISLVMNEWALLELIDMLFAIRKPLASPVKQALLKNPSPAVRVKAAQLVIEMEPDSVHTVAHLIVDPDPKVRAQISPFLTRRRDPQVEAVLRRYLSDRYAQKQDGADLIEHYRRLGLSAGRGSQPFLSAVLLKRDLGSLFGAAADYHRTGAALALMLMPEATGAGEIIRKAARSAFRAVRSACAEAAKLYPKAARAAEGA
ncbi:MAG: HEAT repeat domain-containing protein [Deltaproteobacteria bacterium]|jgi:hypothetical protein|nr:HEAT repeat domain-containing protein [Deltaproteobacteria bacterium]